MRSRTFAALVLLVLIPGWLTGQTAADTTAVLDYLTPRLLLDRAAPGVRGHLAVLHLSPELENIRERIAARLGPLCLNGTPEDGTGLATEIWVRIFITGDSAELHVHHVIPMPGGAGDYSLGYGLAKDTADQWHDVRLASGIGDAFGGTSLPGPQPPLCVGEPSG